MELFIQTSTTSTLTVEELELECKAKQKQKEVLKGEQGNKWDMKAERKLEGEVTRWMRRWRTEEGKPTKLYLCSKIP